MKLQKNCTRIQNTYADMDTHIYLHTYTHENK